MPVPLCGIDCPLARVVDEIEPFDGIPRRWCDHKLETDISRLQLPEAILNLTIRADTDLFCLHPSSRCGCYYRWVSRIESLNTSEGNYFCLERDNDIFKCGYLVRKPSTNGSPKWASFYKYEIKWTDLGFEWTLLAHKFRNLDECTDAVAVLRRIKGTKFPARLIRSEMRKGDEVKIVCKGYCAGPARHRHQRGCHIG